MPTHKSRPDDDETPRLPIPNQVVSNGEYAPRPQTLQQRQVEALTQELAEQRARKLGVKRRDFLRTAAGSATMMFAINQIYGCGGDSGGSGPTPTATPTSTSTSTASPSPSPTATPFNVCEADTLDPERARQIFSSEFFIVDVQTHHVDVSAVPSTVRPFLGALRFRDTGSCAGGSLDCRINLISRQNYIKEMFLDSETAIGVMSGVPPILGAYFLPNETMAATRDEVNALAHSQRCLSQMLIEPKSGRAEARTRVEDIESNIAELGPIGIKCYPGGDLWWLDDEAVAYPMYERAARAGINVISVHKGFPLQFTPMSSRYVQSIDIPKAARDWPQLNFVIYHSGYFPNAERLPDGTVVPAGIEQFASIMEANPDLTNVYAEIGSTFASSIASGGLEAMEIVGRLLKSMGPRRILWGTDSVWWGTPQWQIDAFKAFRISETLQEERGYPALTDEIRAQIFGGNAARLYGIDVDATRCTLSGDTLASVRSELLDDGPRAVAEPHGPRSRREFLQMAALEARFDRLRG